MMVEASSEKRDAKIVAEAALPEKSAQGIGMKASEGLGKLPSDRLSKEIRKRIHERKMETVTTLTGGIAHDYNNLLNVILANISVAKEQTEHGSELMALLQEVENAADEAAALTHQLLMVSRGGFSFREKASVETLVKDIVKGFRSNDGFRYPLHVQRGLWPVMFDAGQLGLAVKNVLQNAVEAMPDGGDIEIRIENRILPDEGEAPELGSKQGKYVKITIRDGGKGISEPVLERIFDPYFTTKPRDATKGTGLGLATAQAVVQKHGGEMLIRSDKGSGTRVTLYLPAVDDGKNPKS